jgi:hypothetical protein
MFEYGIPLLRATTTWQKEKSIIMVSGDENETGQYDTMQGMIDDLP